MGPSELAYRKTSIEGASGFGLLIALYDTLAGNLRRGAEAERRGDIETRCRELNHAFLVIGFLKDRIDRGDDGELSQKLISFYASLRRKLILAQAKRSPKMLDDMMAEILKIRETWQAVERRAATPPETPAWGEQQSHPAGSPAQEPRTASSWSA